MHYSIFKCILYQNGRLDYGLVILQLATGNAMALVFGLLVLVLTVIFFFKKKGIPVPKFAAVEAIRDGVDRAVEMGKPVHYTCGDQADMVGVNTPMTVASLSGLGYTAGLCAQKGARLIVSGPRTAEVMPLMQGIVYDQFKLNGKADKYDIRDIRYFGEQYSPGILDTFTVDGVACNISIGSSSGDALVILDSSRRHGALNIGGTARWVLQYAFAILADYMLIDEEIYAAAAVMSKNEEQIATLRGGDLAKSVVLVMLVVGVLLSVAGSKALQLLLSK